MTYRPKFNVIPAEPIDRPLSAEDVLAMALSMVRAKAFGPRSVEVAFIKLVLKQTGFEIRRVHD